MNSCLNLKMPDDDQAQKTAAWLSLTATLFRSVQAALDRKESLDFARLRAELSTWQSFFTPGDIRRRQWEAADRLLWCAEHAHLVSELDLAHMDHLLSNRRNDFHNDHGGWIWNCTCLLNGLQSLKSSVSVPFALSDENSRSLKATGTVAKLVLHLLRPGTGQLFQHPADSIRASTADDFSASMQDAWVAARSRPDAEDHANSCDGRWRVLLRNGQPVSGITGASASGAATSGWYHMLNGSDYDEGVIVLVQVDSKGEYFAVGGVGAKVRAIMKATDAGSRMDTIVVADDQNEDEANMELGEDSHIRVININARRN